MPISPTGQIITDTGAPTGGLSLPQTGTVNSGGTINSSDVARIAQANYLYSTQAGTQAGRQVSGDPSYKPPAPITSLSSGSVQDRIADNNQTAQGILTAPRGAYTDPNGIERNADGSEASAPEGAMLNPESGVYTSGGKNYTRLFGVQGTAIDASNLKKISDAKKDADTALAADLTNIENQYNDLIKKQTEINTHAEAGLQSSFYQTGAWRGDSSNSLMTATINQGMDKITELKNKEANAKNDIAKAYRDNNQRLLDKSISIYGDIKNEQNTATKEVQKTIQDAQKEATTRLQKLQDEVTAKRNEILIDIGKTHAPSEVSDAVGKATTVSDMIRAAGDYLQTATGDLGQALAIKTELISKGITPPDISELLKQVKTMNAKATGASDDSKLLSVSDAKALEVPYGTTIGQARQIGKTPSDLTSSTKTMLEAAPQVKRFVEKVKKQVADAESGLGPMASRWRDFKQGKVGLSDPAFSALTTNISLLTTLLMRMHVGARGSVQLRKDFAEMINTGKQSPDNLQSSLDQIGAYADELIAEKNGGKDFTPSSAKEQIVQTEDQAKQKVFEYGKGNQHNQDAIRAMVKDGVPYSKIIKALNI